VLAVLLRVGALEGLAAIGNLKAALALVGAGAVSRAAAVSFTLLHSASDLPAGAGCARCA